LRAVKKTERNHVLQKRNPLTSRSLMHKLNPFDKIRREATKAAQEARHKAKVAGAKALRKDKKTKQAKTKRNFTHKQLQDGLVNAYRLADQALANEEALDRMVADDEEEDDE